MICGYLTRGVAVEGEQVDSAGGDVAQDARGCSAGNVGAENLRGLGTKEGQEVGTETSNVGGSHGGTGDGVGGGSAANPRGKDAGARSEDIDDSTVVGVAGTGIGRGSGTNCADGGLGGRRGEGSVGVVVTGSNGKEDSGRDHVGGSGVHGRRSATTETHVGNRAVGAASGARVGGDEVHAGNDTRSGAGTRGAENLDGVDVGLLGDTVGGSANGTSDVSSVTVAVRVVAVDIVGEPCSTATELLKTLLVSRLPTRKNNKTPTECDV